MGRKSEEQKQQEALNRWIKVSDETYDVFSRWQYDFMFMFAECKKRLREEGEAKFRDMSDEDVEKICRELREKEEKEKEEEQKNPSNTHTIRVWHDWSEKDCLTLLRAFCTLSSEDKNTIMSCRSIFERD